MLKLFLISNMYPSPEHPNYGVFVKNFERLFINSGGEIKYKAVLTKPKKNSFLKLFSYLRHYLAIIKIGLFSDYDVIYVHYVAHNSIPLLIISRLTKKKIILNVHGDDILPRTVFVKFLQFFVKKLILNSELVVVPSKFFEKKIIELSKNNVKEVYISPSGGIDLNIFNSKQRTHKVNENPQNISVGFVSRIDKGKGWDLFLELVYKLNKSKLFIATGIIVGSGSEDNSLSNKIHELNLVNSIERYPNLNHKELANVYREMDLFIFPTTLFESLGLVGLESMACGTPIIGSNIGGLKTYISEGINGFLFQPNNIEDLFKKTLNYLALNESEKFNMIKNCELTAKEYDSGFISYELYKKIMSISKSNTPTQI